MGEVVSAVVKELSCHDCAQYVCNDAAWHSRCCEKDGDCCEFKQSVCVEPALMAIYLDYITIVIRHFICAVCVFFKKKTNCFVNVTTGERFKRNFSPLRFNSLT